MILQASMWHKELGSTGVHIPEIGLGTSDYRGGPAPLRAGLETGARFIDTAESYGTEPVVAEAIRGRVSATLGGDFAARLETQAELIAR